MKKITLIRVMTACAFASLCAVAAHAATPAAQPLPAGVVAIVNGTPIPQTQLDEAVHVAMATGHQPDTPRLRAALRQQLIARELFRQSAEKAGYGTKPEVVQAMNAAKAAAETQLYLKDHIRPEPVTDAQVKARYDQIVASLGKEEYKPSVIVVPDAATATVVLAQLKAGQPFSSLAREYSKAPSAAQGGAMAWVSFKTPVTQGQTQGLPVSVAQALTALPVGGVTPEPIALGAGANGPRAIVKLDAKRATQIPPFDQAQASVRQQLQALALEKAAAQFTGGLMKDATIVQ
jgi:peptidyl-prolyl cis-trans isomerase C